MYTLNKNIPFGKEPQGIYLKMQKVYEKETYPNSHAYNGPCALTKVYNCHKDNNGVCYNGIGNGSGSSRIRVPSIKRSRKIWKNFYLMFPKYKEILDECIAGKRKCVISGNTVSVEIPETSHRTFVDTKIIENEDGTITEKEVLVQMNSWEDKKYILHQNTVKLLII